MARSALVVTYSREIRPKLGPIFPAWSTSSLERFFTGAFGASEMIIEARTRSGARFRRPTHEKTTWKIKTSRFINQPIQVGLNWGPGDRYTFLVIDLGQRADTGTWP